MLKKYVRNFNANIYLNAAQELGIQFAVLDKHFSLCQLNFGKVTTLLNVSDLGVNSYSSGRLANNKELSAIMLKKVTTIGPKYITFNSNTDLPRTMSREIYALSQQNDIVIKAPLMACGKGIYIKPNSKRQVRRAVHELCNIHHVSRILVEPHFEASSEFRIIIFRGHILDVLQRKPASVTGDGTSTIKQLIELKNVFRKKYLFKPIIYDRGVLRKHGYRLRTVPKSGEHILLQSACNLALGGEVERCPASLLHPDYKKIIRDLYQTTLLHYVGLDLMTTDPSAKPNPKIAFINEFNSRPTPDASYFADCISNQHLHGVKKILTAVQTSLNN